MHPAGQNLIIVANFHRLNHASVYKLVEITPCTFQSVHKTFGYPLPDQIIFPDYIILWICAKLQEAGLEIRMKILVTEV
uniref:Uncharacterized protein n=1 Tax=Oryza glumipatula TaxID=40148 RepID=A0A0D9YSL5_9ORYZ